MGIGNYLDREVPCALSPTTVGVVLAQLERARNPIAHGITGRWIITADL